MIRIETIDFKYIEERYKALLEQTLIKVPVWHTKAIGVELASRKAVYAEVTPGGVVKVNPAFIGTTAFKKLDQTLLHEFAHLIAGLDQHHNKQFRAVCHFIGVAHDDECEQQALLVSDAVNYKYTVYAHLSNGERRLLGQIHRKTKLYSEYKPTMKRKHRTKDGHTVLNYEIVDN